MPGYRYLLVAENGALLELGTDDLLADPCTPVMRPRHCPAVGRRSRARQETLSAGTWASPRATLHELSRAVSDHGWGDLLIVADRVRGGVGGLRIAGADSSVRTISAPRRAWLLQDEVLCVPSPSALAREFLELVLKNARESQTVPAVARVLGVSRSTLERVSRSCLRLAPGLLIDLVRIRSIARDLRDTHDSAKSIAWGHSYTSPSNMTRRFLEFTGVTPVAYRHCWRLLMGAGEQK